MNNLKELAADEMNSCIFVSTTFCGEPYHSHAQLNVHVCFLGVCRQEPVGDYHCMCLISRFHFIMAAKCWNVNF